jgi:hypothetical protein
MSDKTEGESSIFHLTVRSWIALMVTTTLCYMSLKGTNITEPFYTVVTLIIGVYFGRATAGQQGNGNGIKLPLDTPGTTVSVESTTSTPPAPIDPVTPIPAK